MSKTVRFEIPACQQSPVEVEIVVQDNGTYYINGNLPPDAKLALHTVLQGAMQELKEKLESVTERYEVVQERLLEYQAKHAQLKIDYDEIKERNDELEKLWFDASKKRKAEMAENERKAAIIDAFCMLCKIIGDN